VCDTVLDMNGVLGEWQGSNKDSIRKSRLGDLPQRCNNSYWWSKSSSLPKSFVWHAEKLLICILQIYWKC